MSDLMDQPEPPKRRPKAFRPHQQSEIPAEFYEALREDTSETTPEPAYDGGNDHITVALSRSQVGLIVYVLMEQSKQMPVAEQMEWARLALGLNDLLVAENEVHRGGAESG